MKLFLLAASLRKASLNKQLIRLVAKKLKDWGQEVHLAEFQEFDMPLYNADIQDNVGFPATVHKFIRRMEAADGMIISIPEYNFSIPGTFKNLIDWVSRVRPMPWKGRYIQLLSASPAVVGGNRSLWATRVPLESCGAFIHPDMFSLSTAHKAFTEKDELIEKNTNELLTQMLNAFLEFLNKVKEA